MKPLALFLFNSSAYAVQPWLDGGFDCVSIDYDDTDHSGHNRAGEYISIDLSSPLAYCHVMTAIGYRQPSVVISFAPCTDLAVSGARWFKKKLQNDPDCQHRAVRMAKLATWFKCPYVVENPVSILSTRWRNPDMIWHPYEFAGFCPMGEHPEFPGLIPSQDRYRKQTCIWVGNGFNLPTTAPRAPLETHNPGWAKLGGKSARTKYIRSLTPRGFANAIYLANGVDIMDRWKAQYTNVTEGDNSET